MTLKSRPTITACWCYPEYRGKEYRRNGKTDIEYNVKV